MEFDEYTDNLARFLHEMYLEAIERLSPESCDLNARKFHEELMDGRKFNCLNFGVLNEMKETLKMMKESLGVIGNSLNEIEHALPRFWSLLDEAEKEIKRLENEMRNERQ